MDMEQPLSSSRQQIINCAATGENVSVPLAQLHSFTPHPTAQGLSYKDNLKLEMEPSLEVSAVT